MRECYLCGSDLEDHGPPVCGPCNEMTARGNHGAALLGPPLPLTAAPLRCNIPLPAPAFWDHLED